VQAALDEALKLETALRKLDAETRVVLLHYAPIPETLHGEPEVIWPFLGSSRLLPPIETYRRGRGLPRPRAHREPGGEHTVGHPGLQRRPRRC
jgi:hypothetical protein